MRARAQARVRRALAQHHAGHPPARLNVRRRAVRAAPADLVQAAARQVLRARGARAAGHPGEHPARAPAGGAAGRRRPRCAAARGRCAGRRGVGVGLGRGVGWGGAGGTCGAGRGGRAGPARGGSGGRGRARGSGARGLGQHRRRPGAAGAARRSRCCFTDGRCHAGAARNLGPARGMCGMMKRPGTAAHGQQRSEHWCARVSTCRHQRIGVRVCAEDQWRRVRERPVSGLRCTFERLFDSLPLTACRVVITPCFVSWCFCGLWSWLQLRANPHCMHAWQQSAEGRLSCIAASSRAAC
jgi:hypothetical protein